MEIGAMKVKKIFLWLILLLSLFSDIRLAVSDVNKNKSNEIGGKPTNMTGSFSVINKININKQNIKKNSLDINNININYNEIDLILNDKISENNSSIKNIYYRLSEASKKIGSMQTEISDSMQTEITKNIESTNKRNETIDQNATDIRINRDNIILHKKMLSDHVDNSGQYKSDIEQINKTLNNLNQTLNKLNQTSGMGSDSLDRFWVLIAALLVFFMQAGFKTFKSGMVRKANSGNVAIKNVLDWIIISLVYFLVGFGFMYGDSLNGLLGTNLFVPTFAVMQETKNSIDGQFLGLEFFLFQLAFAAIAATIVTGAMSERIALIPYLFLTVFIGAIIYPVFGHWAWGGNYLLNDQGWLYALGFRDFAGSTVVHSIGAWVALAGIIVIGARNGRYDKHGNLNRKDFIPSDLGYSTLGVFILWFGWWGLNGGSQLKYDENIATIIINTNLAGSAAGITAFFHALLKSRDNSDIFRKLLGGILGGLVAISASCNSVSAWEALLIGGVAGLVFNYSYDFLIFKLKLDDPVGAVAIHGFCGVWGTMCVAFFGDLEANFFFQNSEILFSEHSLLGFLGDANIRIKQAVVQLIGIVTAFTFSFFLSFLFFKLIRKIPGIGLRVLPSDEKNGILLGISN